MSLECPANTVGLSPGHFGRKFHRSAGESLGRFLNRQRIGTPFALLRAGGHPLARIARDRSHCPCGTMVQIFQLEPHGVASHVAAGVMPDSNDASG